MYPFTAILLSFFGLVFLHRSTCDVVDSRIQPSHFVGSALARSERHANKGKPGKEKHTAAKHPLADGNPSTEKKNSTSPRIIRPKRAKRNSKYDLLHGMYTEYKYNWHFNSFSLKDASSKSYSKVKDFFEPLIDQILDENELPNLASNSGRKWQWLNESLLESYENERGVIVYDQDFFRWVYCGWLIIDSNNIRMCAPLLPLGLEDIKRMALKDNDYIPKDTAKYLHRFAQKLVPSRNNGNSKKSKSSSGKRMLAVGLRKIVSTLLTVREDFWLVDLFADNADTYNQNCIDYNAESSDCAPICCYSTYIGSSFCTEHPMNCIYFKG